MLDTVWDRGWPGHVKGSIFYDVLNLSELHPSTIPSVTAGRPIKYDFEVVLACNNYSLMCFPQMCFHAEKKFKQFNGF